MRFLLPPLLLLLLRSGRRRNGLGRVELLGRLEGGEEDGAADPDPDDPWLPALEKGGGALFARDFYRAVHHALVRARGAL
jgi:hypothetical protein